MHLPLILFLYFIGTNLWSHENRTVAQFVILQLSYNAILHLESYCSTIAIFFTILRFYKSR